MKKILISVTLLFIVILSACTNTESVKESEQETAAIANPIVETDHEGFIQKTGLDLNIPEGAKNIRFLVINNELGEIRFTLDGMEFSARIKSTDEFEDISGMYYKWTVEEDAKVDRCQARSKRYIGSDIMIDVVCWFDAAPGISYSLSAEGKDLNGFDIIAIAEQVFKPMQGDVG